MRSIDAGALPTASRTISGYITVYNNLPSFDEYADNEGALQILAHDIDHYGTGFLRAVSGSDDDGATAGLHTMEVADPDSLPAGFTDKSIALIPGSGVSVYGNYIYCHKSNGSIIRFDYDTSAEMIVDSSSYPTAIAATGEETVYLLKRYNDNSYRLYYQDGPSTFEFPGAIYGSRDTIGVIDAVTVDGRDYVYVQTENGKSARVLCRDGQQWGPAENIIPLDVVDDTSSFVLSSASVIDGRAVVTGILKRQDYSMQIYTIGPEHYTMGRELYISDNQAMSDTADGASYYLPSGKMLLYDDRLWVFGGDGTYHVANATRLFGVDRTDEKATFDMVSLSLSDQANRPGRVIVKLPSSVQSDVGFSLLKGGNVIEVYATINETDVKIGEFSIDSVFASKSIKGEDVSVTARSKSSKNLTAWKSDSSYDYWSQEKQVDFCDEVGELIRGDGEWEEAEYPYSGISILGDHDSYIELQSFNEGGILYTVNRSTRNAEMDAELFIPSNSDYSAKVGVGVAYYRETPQDAAERLGEDFATDHDCLNNGFFFIVDSSDGSTYLYFVRDDEWTELETGSTLTLSGDTWLRAKIRFNEGFIACYVKEDDTWVECLTHRFVTPAEVESPWFRDEVGRAAVYLENVTPHADSYAFDSQSGVIPLETNADFPASDIVKVDQELITYSSKTDDMSPLGPFDWYDGQTFTEAPHDNSYEFPEFVVASADSPSTAEDLDGTYQLWVQSFVASDYWEISKVSLHVELNGSPGDVTVYIGNDDCDNGWYPPADSLIAQGTLSTTENGWTDVVLDETIKLLPNEAYFIIVESSGDATNHYKLSFQPNINTNRHLCRTYQGGWTTRDQTMCFKVYGRSKSMLPGYEIYFDPEDSVSREPTCFDGMALVITDGPGKGRAFTITGYDYDAPYQWVPTIDPPPIGWETHVGDLQHGAWVDQGLRRIFVEENPSGLGEGTKAIITSALEIDERGITVEEDGSYTPEEFQKATHPAGICSVWREAYAGGRYFHYVGGHADRTLEDMALEILAKSGNLDAYGEKIQSETISGSFTPDYTALQSSAIEGESAIIKFYPDPSMTGSYGVVAFSGNENPFLTIESDRVVLISPTDISLYYRASGTNTLLESFPLDNPLDGEVIVSFQRTNFAVWASGSLVAFFPYLESHADETTFNAGFKVSPIYDGTVNLDIDWGILDQRIDNFILDISVDGYSLLSSLIGEKRVFFLDDADGDMRLFRTRETVNSGSPNTLAVAQSSSSQDTAVRSRLRIEGAEIVEILDTDAIKEHGNLFELIGLREAENILDAKREGELIQEDMIRAANHRPFRSAADLRVEPEDIYLIDIGDGSVSLVVRSINLNMRISGKEAVLDMDIEAEEII